jgi:hypothetical protein
MRPNRGRNAHKRSFRRAANAATVEGVKGTATHCPVPSAVLRGSLRDGLLVCLGLLAKDPERFERAAVVWHRRWCAERPGIGFAESRAVLSALEALSSSDPEAAAADLLAACPETQGVEEVLDGWLEQRSRGVPN